MIAVNFVSPMQLPNSAKPTDSIAKWFWLVSFVALLLGIYWFTNC